MTVQESESAVVHDAQAQQFRVGDGADAAVLQYQIARGRIMFMHTSVPDALRGQGLAQKLAHAGLEYARTEGLPVVVFCPFVRAYLAKHPEYQSLVVG